MPTDLEVPTQRVEHLEHENRRLKRFGLAVLILIGGALAIGQAGPPETIEAETFLVKDINGKVKAKIDAMNGSAELLFYDHAGQSADRTHINGELQRPQPEGWVPKWR